MQKVTLTNPNQVSILRRLVEDTIIERMRTSHNGEIQQLFDIYLSLGGYFTWEQFEKLAKPAPKTASDWLKEIFGGE